MTFSALSDMLSFIELSSPPDGMTPADSRLNLGIGSSPTPNLGVGRGLPAPLGDADWGLLEGVVGWCLLDGLDGGYLPGGELGWYLFVGVVGCDVLLLGDEGCLSVGVVGYRPLGSGGGCELVLDRGAGCCLDDCDGFLGCVRSGATGGYRECCYNQTSKIRRHLSNQSVKTTTIISSVFGKPSLPSTFDIYDKEVKVMKINSSTENNTIWNQ